MYKFLISLLLICILPLIASSFNLYQWNALNDDESNLKTNATIQRFKRQSNCNNFQHRCDSGECIDDDNVCDGLAQCKDASDETQRLCGSFNCRGAYQCSYGACINQELRCNGRKDCHDNSDEQNCKNDAADDKGSNSNSGQCGPRHFQCKSGQCIDDYDVCDGSAQCADASDESADKCSSLKCPKFTFKCNYGACINEDYVCNNIKDCYDNSDETNCAGRPTNTLSPGPATATDATVGPTITQRPSTLPNKDKCYLPAHPANGKWSLLIPNNQLTVGDEVSLGTVINYQCNTGFALYPKVDFVLCNDMIWSASPKCLKTCSPIDNSAVMTATCTLNGNNVSCADPVEGTRAMLKCRPLYEDRGLSKNPFRHCQDGSWDYPLPLCEPVCGLKSVDAQQLVIGGKNVSKGEYPWQVGVYKASDRQQICGASIISPKVVLSAAHCFESTDAKDYLIAAGKYYRIYDDLRDVDAQYSNIKSLIIHGDYNGGEPHYAFDIAIIVAATPFRINKYVLPVCIEYNPQFDADNLADEKGVVTGWGYTASDSKPSEVLKALEVDYKTKAKCKLPKEFIPYYTHAPDKMCAGLLNKGESACQGDSGGGLVFPIENRYYIRGIVSLAPRKSSGGCDETQLALYTSIKYHAEFILDQVAKHKRS